MHLLGALDRPSGGTVNHSPSFGLILLNLLQAQVRHQQVIQNILARIPDHPGAQHYKIHAFDFPLLAGRALEVCDSYGSIAPDVPQLRAPSSKMTIKIGAGVVAFYRVLPAALSEEAKRELGVSEVVADLVLPLGASMYRAGSALFQGAAIVFLAWLFDVPIPAAAVGGAVLATFLVSLTVAPVPSSGVMTLAPALDTVGIPLAGLSILLGIDRIPDMFRSSVNLLGQITTAVVVDRWVGSEAVAPATGERSSALGDPSVATPSLEVTQGAATLDFKPKCRIGALLKFSIDTPGIYLVRVETRNTKRDHEHFAAIDLEVK